MKNDRKNIILQSLASLLPSKRAIYAELFSFCDDAIFNKCAELKKSDLSSRDKVKNTFLFFMIFIEKNKGFARLVSREALSTDEQNVSDAVNQFFERLELSIKQMLAEDSNNLIISAQLIVTCLEGNVGRYIRSKFKDSPSNYIENVWELLSVNIFKK
ncbi:MAG: nucleoid occlusion factor SlmA [Proteobacteria bacterium]|nr:nucleoid occlusion factor SlmA [Pseudomonadota bacterium]